MGENLDCPYVKRCKEAYPEPEIEEHRKRCDCINCALCDYYWSFYDRNRLAEWNRIHK